MEGGVCLAPSRLPPGQRSAVSLSPVLSRAQWVTWQSCGPCLVTRQSDCGIQERWWWRWREASLPPRGYLLLGLRSRASLCFGHPRSFREAVENCVFCCRRCSDVVTVQELMKCWSPSQTLTVLAGPRFRASGLPASPGTFSLEVGQRGSRVVVTSNGIMTVVCKYFCVCYMVLRHLV